MLKRLKANNSLRVEVLLYHLAVFAKSFSVWKECQGSVPTHPVTRIRRIKFVRKVTHAFRERAHNGVDPSRSSHAYP